ncbi:MAG: MBL fold metallo-hydrolase [bacterium]
MLNFWKHPKIFKCIYLINSVLIVFIFSCINERNQDLDSNNQEIVVLGIAQDAGYPHINNSDEWSELRTDPSQKRLVISLGLVDHTTNQKWLIEATPDMPQQLDELETNILKTTSLIDGVFLTHAHIGHYTGLMYFGREAMGAKDVPVYAMPQMKKFIESNGPWNQLVSLNNIQLNKLQADSTVRLSANIRITPFLVPHRAEYAETVGYKIEGPTKSALFIPDIDKWELWGKSILEEVVNVDYAFLDATFFKDGEIPRPMNEVPHPFIEETVQIFKNTTKEIKNKIIFIHFNHSNPAIDPNNADRLQLEEEGFRFGSRGMRLGL